MSEKLRGNFEMEKTREVTGKYVGRFGDLGLGNAENGIPSKYAEYDTDSLNDLAERYARKLVPPTDLIHTACVDGRCTLCNADGSKAEIRLRRVGGSASNYGVARNAGASIVATLGPNTSLTDGIQKIDDFMGERSAHEGGCGGAGGEVEDNELIAYNPNILKAAYALLSIPVVTEYLGVAYSDVLAQEVRTNAAETAQFEREQGWDGQKYVDGVKKQNPRGVEVLEVDPNDHEHHGHKEPDLTIIIGDDTLPNDHEGFVWNLKATKLAAERLSGQQGDEGYLKAVLADVMKHMAVCNRLPRPEAPIMLIGSEEEAA